MTRENSNDSNKEIKIIYLPTIGKPLSIKTLRQGRKISIQSYLDKDKKSPIPKNKRLRYNAKNWRVLAIRTLKRIINSRRSNSSQKEFALDVLNKINNDVFVGKEPLSSVYRINKTLSLTFKDY